MKFCRGCGQTKPLSDFYVDKSRKDGVLSRCKVCHESYRKLKRAGLEPEHFDNPDEVIVCSCMCCKTPFRTDQAFRLCPSCRSGEVVQSGYISPREHRSHYFDLWEQR